MKNERVPGLTHYNSAGDVHMVDVGGKSPTERSATASGFVVLSQGVMEALPSNPKGNPLEIARIAGIMAAKRTSELIPLCHLVALSSMSVEISHEEQGLAIRATATAVGPTGVEMEALTAVSVAALTIYDMCKALDKSILIRGIQLDSKTGGKSGGWLRAGD